MSTTLTVESVPGKRYLHVLTARHHQLNSDAGIRNKGADAAASPHEIFLLGLATCTAMTIQMFADTKGWPLTGVKIYIKEDKTKDPDDPSKTIPHIIEEIELMGTLDQNMQDKLLDIAKRCPVYKLLVGKKVVDTILLPPPTAPQVSTSSTASSAPSSASNTDPLN